MNACYLQAAMATSSTHQIISDFKSEIIFTWAASTYPPVPIISFSQYASEITQDNSASGKAWMLPAKVPITRWLILTS